jgi:ankyrin repeat protein
VFLEHGGNPNSPNGREETCLHSICRRSDNPRLRLEIMETLLAWRGEPVGTGSEGFGTVSPPADALLLPPAPPADAGSGLPPPPLQKLPSTAPLLLPAETVSVNHTDVDGNSAAHYASARCRPEPIGPPADDAD